VKKTRRRHTGDALEVIRSRRSIRQFKNEDVPRRFIENIIDAGRLAPTARNIQPWDFVVVTEPHFRRQIADIAEHGKFMSEAPVCILVLSKDTKYYLEDGSAATATMMLAASALGLAACWVAGDKKSYSSKIVSLCGAPPGYKLVSMVAVGYPGETPSPEKRPLTDVLHWERY
jgi:nitroreductase